MSHEPLIPARLEPPSLPLPFPLPLTRAGLSGFPSPAQDYEGRTLDLNERLVKRPASTFFMTVTGDSMEALGIDAGDLLVVDSAIEPRPGHILVASVEGELVVKRYELLGNQLARCRSVRRQPRHDAVHGDSTMRIFAMLGLTNHLCFLNSNTRSFYIIQLSYL